MSKDPCDWVWCFVRYQNHCHWHCHQKVSLILSSSSSSPSLVIRVQRRCQCDSDQFESLDSCHEIGQGQVFLYFWSGISVFLIRYFCHRQYDDEDDEENGGGDDVDDKDEEDSDNIKHECDNVKQCG